MIKMMMTQQQRLNAQHTFIFMGLLIAVAFYYGYGQQWSWGPRSIHQWRQCDGASIALNYYQNGMQFWQPETHHLQGGTGRNVGEFPILYYIIAACYGVFGEHDGIFRLVNFAVLVVGLLAFSKLLRSLLRDDLLSFALPLLLFASPIVGYYGFNFLTNAPALGLALVGWYAFFHYYHRQKMGCLYAAAAAFGMAGLLKVDALLTYVPLIGFWVLERLGLAKHFGARRPLFAQKWHSLVPLALVVVVNVAWYIWAQNYNAKYSATYFRIGGYAFWELSGEQMASIGRQIIGFWLPSYFHPFTMGCFGLGWIFIAFTPRRHEPFWYAMTIITLVGVLLFAFLWYEGLGTHDYYMVTIMLVPILWATALAVFVQQHAPAWIATWAFKISVAIFVVFNIWHAKTTIADRYDPAGIEMQQFNPIFYEKAPLRQFIADLHITRDQLVISIPDGSPSISLYYLNLRGWTDLYHHASTPESIETLITYGAKYLIINDKKYLNDPRYAHLLTKPVGSFRDTIFVFALY